MNKYEEIYLKAAHRAKGSAVSWLDSAVAALAVDLESYVGEVFEIGGPYGLRAEVVISSPNYSLTVVPCFEDNGLKLYYDTGKKKQNHQPNTIGAVNGFNNLQARLPNTIVEIVAIMTPLNEPEKIKEKVECPLSKGLAYEQQQLALDEIAGELGVVCYRPHYHGVGGDKNTVMVYTLEDAAYSFLMNEKESESFADMAEKLRPPKCDEIIPRDIAPNYFWQFENSDADGVLSYDFANVGKIDLRSDRWCEILKGAIQVALIGKRQREHILRTGGWNALREADEVYNDLNRERIAAFKICYEDMRLGDITFNGEKRLEIIAGRESVYKEYDGERIYNFSCSFCVPKADPKLEAMIRAWNRNEQLPKSGKAITRITKRIEALGGFFVVWF